MGKFNYYFKNTLFLEKSEIGNYTRYAPPQKQPFPNDIHNPYLTYTLHSETKKGWYDTVGVFHDFNSYYEEK